MAARWEAVGRRAVKGAARSGLSGAAGGGAEGVAGGACVCVVGKGGRICLRNPKGGD